MNFNTSLIRSAVTLENTNDMDIKQTQMIESPVERLICRLAIPSMILMLVSALYSMADTYFVSSLGTSATAAVGVVFALMAIIQALGLFFGHGSGNYISRQLGAKNFNEAKQMAATGCISTLIGGVVITILGIIFLKPLAILMGSTDTILPYACDYLFYILLAAPFMAASFTLNNLLRFQGSSFYGMVGITAGAILNVGLDPLFIFVFHMGVRGAAIATMISQIVSFSLLLFGCTLKGNIKISLKNFSPSRHAYKEMFRGGLPSLCMNALAAISVIFLNQVAGNFGDAVIAAMSIVQRVTMFAASALIGFGQGFQPVCGFNYGAKRYDRVKKAFWFCFKVTLVALCILTIVGYIFTPQILEVFRKDDIEVM
jgi:putative MATE family efflux protein